MEKRKVDPNEPARPVIEVVDYKEDRVGNDEIAATALKDAEALLKAYNQ